MRRLLNTLMILLVVLLAGLSSLVLLINPNDFRHYLQQAAARSGYQLTLTGTLRWHVWPQLSILTGSMSLRAPGASQSLINAENMRLDVQLLPLLSHRLQIKQVLLSNAVIQLNDDSQPQRPPDAPRIPTDNSPSANTPGFTIARLQIINSILVLQRRNDTPVTVRDINLSLTQTPQHQGELTFSGSINRNQQSLALSLVARLDASHYPQQWQAHINKLTYQLQGADLPQQGISGQGSITLQWQETEQKLLFSQLHLTANNSQMDGQGSVSWQVQPSWQLALHFTQLDLDNLLSAQNSEGQPLPNSLPLNQPAPVIARLPGDRYHALRNFNARLALQASQLHWRGLTFADVQAQLQNQSGLLTITQLQGNIAGGQLALPGSLDARGKQPLFHFQPAIRRVPIAALLQAFGYPSPFNGALTLNGTFSGATLSAPAFRQHWQGQAQIGLQDLRLAGLNIPQLVNQALVSSNNQPFPATNDNATQLTDFSANLRLNKGVLTLNPLAGQAAQFNLSGTATVDLLHQQSDARLNIQLTSLPVNDDNLIALLKNTPIPLRIYGAWDQLNYSFPLSELLQDNLRGQARQRLEQWLQQQRSKETTD